LEHIAGLVVPANTPVPFSIGDGVQKVFIEGDISLFGMELSTSKLTVRFVNPAEIPTAPLPETGISFEVSQILGISPENISISLSMQYSEDAIIGRHFSESDLVLYRYDPVSGWAPVAATLAPDIDRIYAVLDGFGLYALLSGAALGVGEGVNLPTTATIIGNKPNPFNATTAITYYLPDVLESKLTIYNLVGEKVTEFSNEPRKGMVTVLWNGQDRNGENVPSGIYFARLEAGRESDVRRVILLK